MLALTGKIESFVENLPDAESARRFYTQLAEKYPAEIKKLSKNEGLLSDVLTLAAFSPLLATTVLQNPGYIAWLNRQRVSTLVRGKDEIVESLARFALTNSSVETNVLLARFRRRELLRIYLRDIRNLATVAEITEEISHLADAIIEYALRTARQELDNRYGSPLETDGKNRTREARFCIVALGKLGSNELNYASDIDLLFLYSSDGATSGHGARGAVTNREYFIKLAETITKLLGAPTGEGAAYRVDLRLRPNGRVGALAISAREAINYYANSAQSWERQVLIRSRVAAGDADVFQTFFRAVKSSVFSVDETVGNALANVRQSKEKINAQKISEKNFNVKLGRGGIREIEFIAQALQLAYGGRDEWVRAPHTLISLERLADRRHLTKSELTELYEAYDFLRRLEHRLQMENGLQTHLVPHETERRLLTARRMNCESLAKFDEALKNHSANVNRIFERVFRRAAAESESSSAVRSPHVEPPTAEKIAEASPNVPTENSALPILVENSPYYAEMLAANPNLSKDLPDIKSDFAERDYREILLAAVAPEIDYKSALSVLRIKWSRFLLEIAAFDVAEKLTRNEAKRRQTALAEASIEAAIAITERELEKKYAAAITQFSFAVLGLGKLGGGGVDYGSDLDLILIYDDEQPLPVENLTHAEFYSRAVEIFVTTLSSLTRDGALYRVDLRLRPDGKNGATSIGKTAFLNYLQTRAAMWEWLAYVKLRGAAGDLTLAAETEFAARAIIHRNALEYAARDAESANLLEESRRIRERLEAEKSSVRTGREIDIKFGAGGMLDVYFAVRYLQLRDNIPDDTRDRSTAFILKKLYENRSLSREDYRNFSDGYEFLTELDHHLRLTVGRSSKIPLANQTALHIIARRMRLASVGDLSEQLTVQRLNIRASFDKIFGKQL